MTRIPGIRSTAPAAPTTPPPVAPEQTALDNYINAVWAYAAAYAMHSLFTTGNIYINEGAQ